MRNKQADDEFLMGERKRDKDYYVRMCTLLISRSQLSGSNHESRYKKNTDIVFGRFSIQDLVETDISDDEDTLFHNIPVLTSVFNLLRGENLTIPFKPTVVVDSVKGVSLYQEYYNKKFRSFIEKKVEARTKMLQIQEQGEEVPPSVQRQAEVTQEELKDLEKQIKKGFMPTLAKLATKCIKYVDKSEDVQWKLSQGYEDTIKVNGEIHKVDIRAGEVTHQRIPPDQFAGGGSDNNFYIDEWEWATSYTDMTPTQIVEYYYDHLSEEDIKSLKDHNINNMSSNSGVQMYDQMYLGTTNTTQYITNDGVKTSTVNSYNNKLRVWHTCMKEPVRTGILTYEEEEFGFPIEEKVDEYFKIEEFKQSLIEDAIASLEQERLQERQAEQQAQQEQMQPQQQGQPSPPQDTQMLDSMIIEDDSVQEEPLITEEDIAQITQHIEETTSIEWIVSIEVKECYKIENVYKEGNYSGNDEEMDSIYFNYGINEYQVKYGENKARTRLPYTGMLLSEPSIVDLSKEFILQWLIINKQEELLIKKAKGIIMLMDINMIPDMVEGKGENNEDNTDIWLKMLMNDGIGFIDTKENPQAGQIVKSIDLSLTDTIQNLQAMKANIEAKFKEMIGITPQRQGAIKPTEAVGNVENAQVQSAYITEIYNRRHQMVIERFLTLMLYCIKTTWTSDMRKSFITEGEVEVIEMLEDFPFHDYMVYLTNSNEERLKKQRILQSAEGAMSGGHISLVQFAKLTQSSSVNEAINMLQEIEDDVMLQQQQQQEQQAEQQQQLQQAQAQAEQEKLQQEISKLQLELENTYKIHAETLAFKREELASKTGIEESKIANSGVDDGGQQVLTDMIKHQDSMDKEQQKIDIDKDRQSEEVRNNKDKTKVEYKKITNSNNGNSN